MNETMLKLKDKQKELDVKRELVQAEMQSHKLALKRLEKEFDGYGEELKFDETVFDWAFHILKFDDDK